MSDIVTPIDKVFVPAVGKVNTTIVLEMFDGDRCEYGLNVYLADDQSQATYVGPCPICYMKAMKADRALTNEDMIAIPIERKDGVGKRGIRFIDVERGFDRTIERIANTDVGVFHFGCFTGSIRNNAWRLR